MFFHFLDVALRAASIVENLFFGNCCISSKWQNTFTWLDLGIGSMLERLVLKNAVDCTSQRVKRTSRARVMIVSCLALIGNCIVLYCIILYYCIIVSLYHCIIVLL